ncbi:hypothetical protein BBJ28_00020894, partial [Nothophytophthora sp. Chile5]
MQCIAQCTYASTQGCMTVRPGRFPVQAYAYVAITALIGLPLVFLQAQVNVELDEREKAFAVQDEVIEPKAMTMTAEEEAASGHGDATVQGRVTGIIYPPPDIRAVVDKTAQFVANNGRAFESR